MALGPGTSELTPTLLEPPRVPVLTATVRRQFDRRARAFARHDFLAREIERRMLERLDIIRLEPKRIVDIGCGAGAARAALLARYGGAEWIGIDHSLRMLAEGSGGALASLARRLRGAREHRIAADAGALPLADDRADLVFSNLMLHWHPTPHRLFPEWKRILRADGLLMFSCFGPDTIAELRAAFAATVPRAVPMPYIDMHDFGDMLVGAGFATPVMDAERIRLTYASPHELLREVAALGGNPRTDRARGLVAGRHARALLDALQARRDSDGRIALTFEIAYGHAWKPRASDGSTRIPVDSLRTQLRAR